MCSSKPKVSAAPTVAPASAPEISDESVRAARSDERRRAAETSGRKSTLLTGEEGLRSGTSTKKKTLLGS